MAKQFHTFVTLFPELEDIHLTKDIAMIPYTMQKYYGFQSSLVLYKGAQYQHQKYIKDLHKMYFPFKKHNSKTNSVCFILSQAKNVDVLNMYHIRSGATLICIALYLYLNKTGLVYVHLDASIVDDSNPLGLRGNHISKKIKTFFMSHTIFSKKNSKRILFGIQDPNEAKKIRHIFPFQNIIYSPNGYIGPSLSKNHSIHKQPIILFVGRVDDVQQKRIDLIIQAFVKISSEYQKYKLQIVGKISTATKKKIEQYANKKSLADRIEIKGEITNKVELQKIYQKAQIFCLPSDYESFGLVLTEAIYNGCLIVGSNIPSTKLITQNGKYGLLFEKSNLQSLTKKLSAAIHDTKKQRYVQENGEKYIGMNFSYPNVLENVNRWIQNYYDH